MRSVLELISTGRDLEDPMLADVWADELTLLTFDLAEHGPVGTFRLTVEERR